LTHGGPAGLPAAPAGVALAALSRLRARRRWLWLGCEIVGCERATNTPWVVLRFLRMARALAVALLVAAAGSFAAAEDEVLRVKFDVTSLDGKKGETGSFIMEAHSEWAPLGFARFKEMVEADFFNGVRFFRVIEGFMAQFGIHGKPAIAAEWKSKTLKDDPVVESNKRSYVSFATSGKDSRTTQM
jgi:hypothetical protein